MEFEVRLGRVTEWDVFASGVGGGWGGAGGGGGQWVHCAQNMSSSGSADRDMQTGWVEQEQGEERERDVRGSDRLLSDSEPHIPTLLDRTPPSSTIDFKKRLPVSEDILHVQTKKTWGGVNTQLWSHKMQCSF